MAVARARVGDHEGFRILVERYQGRAFRVALRVLRDEERARDAVQDAFVKAYASLQRFEGRSSFYTWLYRLVMNVCLDARRRDRSGPVAGFAGAAEAAQVAGAAIGIGPQPLAGTPDREVERSQLRRAIARAIEALPQGQREALLLREVDGQSYAEIAEALGISKGTVMSRLHYARRKVQRELIERGLAEAHGRDAAATPAAVRRCEA